MKNVIVIALSVLVSGQVFAKSVECNGKYNGFDIIVRAQVDSVTQTGSGAITTKSGEIQSASSTLPIQIIDDGTSSNRFYLVKLGASLFHSNLGWALILPMDFETIKGKFNAYLDAFTDKIPSCFSDLSCKLNKDSN